MKDFHQLVRGQQTTVQNSIHPLEHFRGQSCSICPVWEKFIAKFWGGGNLYQLKLQFFRLWILTWVSKAWQTKTEPELNYLQYPALYAAKPNTY